MALPKVISNVSAEMSLESPQILTSWDWELDPYWPYWTSLLVVRNYTRFPISNTDGTLLATITRSSGANPYCADTAVTADGYAYYGLYVAHYLQAEVALVNAVTPKSFSLARKVQKLIGVSFDNTTCATVYSRILWFAGIDHSGNRFIAAYEADSPLNHSIEYGTFLRELDLTAILASGEYISGIGDAVAFGGSTRALLVATNRRCMVLDVSATDTITDSEILEDLDLTTRLSSGYQVGWANGTTTAPNTTLWFVVDTQNQEVGQIRVAGTNLRDYSGLSCADYVNGVTVDFKGDGAGNPYIVLSYANHAIYLLPTDAPFTDDDIIKFEITPYYIAEGSIFLNTIVPGIGVPLMFGFMEEDTKQFYFYINAGVLVFRNNQCCHRDWYDNDHLAVGLFHLEDAVGAVTAKDSSGTAVAATAVGGTFVLQQDGYHKVVYNKGWYNPGTSYLNCLGQLPLMKAVDGCIEFFFKADGATFWTTGARMFTDFTGSAATDTVYLTINAGVITATYKNGANIATGTWTATPQDFEWHHYRLCWHVGAGADYVQFYFDGVQRINAAIVFAAFAIVAPTHMQVAGTAAIASPKGYYDEIRLSIEPRTIGSVTYNIVYSRAAWLHAWSGRAYNPPTDFEFRDQLFDDFIPESTRERDFAKRIEHWFPGAILTNGEVVHRSGDLVDGGQLRALMRMYGLILDRVVDYRDRLLSDVDIDTCAYENIGKLSKLVGMDDIRRIPSVFTDDDRYLYEIRKAVKGITEVWKRKGTLNGLRLFAKLFHIALDLDVTYYRRYWDSVVSPTRIDVPLDTMHMDTSSGDSKIGEVSVRAYFMGEHDLQCYADYGVNGLTGAVATSNFDSAGKTWAANPTARIGDMLCIRDRSAGMSVVNGFYLVNGITNDTRLTVNHAWIAGEDAKAALEYIIWRYIPEVDPMAEFIMHWAPLLLPFNMDVVYADPTP